MKCHMCKHEWDNIAITRCPNCDKQKEDVNKVQKSFTGNYDIANKEEDNKQ